MDLEKKSLAHDLKILEQLSGPPINSLKIEKSLNQLKDLLQNKLKTQDTHIYWPPMQVQDKFNLNVQKM